jgi:Icc-related predicted phosphoesterase
MFRAWSHLTPILTLAFALTACTKDQASKTTTDPAKPGDKPAAPQALSSSDPDCIGNWSVEGNVAKIDLSGRAFELQGARLKETATDPDDQLVLGVVANIKEDTPENLKNLQSIVEFFKAEKVDAIVVNGDVGETEQQIANVLEPISALNLPTFVIIGNLEKKSDYNKAVKAVAAKHSNVFDLNHVRLVELDDAVLVSMPGYYDKSYLHAGEDGCHYKAADLAAMRNIIKAAGDAKPVVLVSHGPPRQDGAEAIDRMSPGETNVGDPELMKLIRETGVKFGVFSNIQEAGGRGTNVDGTSLVGEGKPADQLLLNPGPADAVAWKMNDRTESVGMAAVMTVKGKQASFKIHRIAAAAQQ